MGPRFMGYALDTDVATRKRKLLNGKGVIANKTQFPYRTLVTCQIWTTISLDTLFVILAPRPSGLTVWILCGCCLSCGRWGEIDPLGNHVTRQRRAI